MFDSRCRRVRSEVCVCVCVCVCVGGGGGGEWGGVRTCKQAVVMQRVRMAGNALEIWKMSHFCERSEWVRSWRKSNWYGPSWREGGLRSPSSPSPLTTTPTPTPTPTPNLSNLPVVGWWWWTSCFEHYLVISHLIVSLPKWLGASWRFLLQTRDFQKELGQCAFRLPGNVVWPGEHH